MSDTKDITLQNEDIDNELKIQSKLNKAKNYFINDKIIRADIIEAECMVNKHNIKFKNNSYDISNTDVDSLLNERAIYKGDKLYFPLIVINYCGKKQTISKGVFKNKSYAKKELENLKKYYKNNFRFHIKSNKKIIHSKKENKLYEIIKLNNNLSKLQQINIEKTIYLSFISCMLIYMIILMLIFVTSSFFISLQSIVLILSSLFISIITLKSIIDIIDKKFQEYHILDIEENNIKSNVFEEDIDYKTVEATVNINDSELTIYSEEIDATWRYKKTNKVLSENGVELLNKLPISNEKCIITVKNNGNLNSPWKDTRENWWIDTKITFD